MGTKRNPGARDCYDRALPDEPMMTLLARDPRAPELVELWAQRRAQDIASGKRPATDALAVIEAIECAKAMRTWRLANHGKWREPPPKAPDPGTPYYSAYYATMQTGEPWNGMPPGAAEVPEAISGIFVLARHREGHAPDVTKAEWKRAAGGLPASESTWRIGDIIYTADELTRGKAGRLTFMGACVTDERSVT